MNTQHIDPNISFNEFSQTTDRIHHAGIEKFTKTYKQRSHQALISAFFKIIDKHNVTALLEIGAFKAEVSRRFVTEKPARHALAVEANPYNFNTFNDSLTKAGVLYHHAAILDREGPCKLQLRVTDLDDENGYIRGNNSLLKTDVRPDTRDETVPGTTLDTLVSSYVASKLFPAPSVNHPALWIDVEGALDLVIRGGQHSIRNSLMIFAEVETERLWNDQAIFPEIAIQLDELGYFPYLRDCEYEPEQFNVVFANRKLIDIALLEEVASEFYKELKAG